MWTTSDFPGEPVHYSSLEAPSQGKQGADPCQRGLMAQNDWDTNKRLQSNQAHTQLAIHPSQECGHQLAQDNHQAVCPKLLIPHG